MTFDQKPSVKFILIDIEGTTTDIAFVKDVLFPYASDNCKEFLNKLFDEPDVKEIVRDLCKLSEEDGNPIQKSTNKHEFINSIVDNVKNQIKADRKTKELKNLQGKIWKEAFESGAIKGHLYDDVPRNFEKWVNQGFELYIYSSGSVEAQKLLFKYSKYGNMLKYLSGHFDTNVGHKQETQSYKNITKELQAKAEEILFLSDIPNEVIAAEEAGMKVTILDRPNNPLILSQDNRKNFQVVQNFDEIKCN
ncbi:CLUMA_CG010986, isoform A [Clunio marinus]|uniref:CLUMA_CG010986, isoform A n=1 Tax=Clunio marinus TaxID=568069 RepID=A0A1J1IBI6_9DIPT|nr:CLUMA_CG010986, isoform A [Clunio marinus]